MRSSIADYEVTEVLEGAEGAGTAYRCRPPERMRIPGPEGTDPQGPDPRVPAAEVMVAELAVDASGWGELTDRLMRTVAIGSAHLLRLLEVGPDLETGGVFVVSEAPQPAPPAGPMDTRRAVARVESVALGAHALHEAGLAHGDIRPAAVFDTERGPVLGLPRLDRSPGWVVEASSWRDLVTVDPERIGGEAPSRSSDIWALGALLNTLASERPLYPDIDRDEPVTAVQRLLFTRPEVDPALPAAVRDLIEACLAVDPADRPTTAAAVAERARRVIDDLPANGDRP